MQKSSLNEYGCFFVFSFVIAVVIMIKSSEPGLTNTYRIIRVLSNQDYLATDHNDHRFIFSEITTSSQPPIPASYRHQEALLRHREIIAIDGMQYAVFEVGTQEVVWAPLIRAKKLEQKGFIQMLMKKSTHGILKELVWMGNNHANKYLDFKNFWLIGEELRLLLVPRREKPRFTIKKCQHRSLSGDKSIDQLMEAEKTLMKEFALLLWQICFQRSHYDDQCVTAHGRTKQILRMMVNRAIGYEELMKELSKQPFQGIYKSKIKSRSPLQQDLVPRRRTLSFISPNRSLCNTINNSRLVQANTETLKRPYHTIQKQESSMYQSIVDQKPKANDQMRSSSAESTLLQSGTSFRKSRYLNKRQCTQSSSKETVHYERWLQSKRYSMQTREKLIRNGEIARKKYTQAIEFSTRQANSSIGGRQEKLDDSLFKAKILSKVIRFKDAMKEKKAIVPTIQEEESSKRSKTQCPQEIQQLQKKVAISITLSENKEHPSPPQQVQTLRNQPAPPPPKKQPAIKAWQQAKKESAQIRKIQNEFMHVAANEPSSLSSLKTQKKKLNRIDVLSGANTFQDLQEVALEQPKVVMPAPKKKDNVPQKLSVPSHPPAPPKAKLKTMQPSEALNELLMMVNTLGDITVRAIKQKDQLPDINVRQATYFLYQRFHHERSMVMSKLNKGQMICRQHRHVQEQEWAKYLSSQAKGRAFGQMAKENEQITSTLNKLGHKMLQQQTVQRKIEYFIKNRQKVLEKSEPGLRKQLSRFLISSLVSQFDYAWQEKLNSELVVNFMGDLCFGAYVVGELDGVIPPQKYVRLDNYKEYKTLSQLKPVFDFIDEVYFPKESPKQTQ